MGLLDSILGTVGGILGKKAAQGDLSTAEDLQNQNLADARNLALPDYEKMIRQYALQTAGKEYTPEQLVAEQMSNNYMNNVNADPNMISKQNQYMDYLQEISKQGMTPDEAAQRNALMRQMEGSSQGKITDIQNQAAMAGMGSSGATLLAKMNAQQQAQNAGSQSADSLAAQMFQRKMGAQGSLAQQAQNMDQTQYQRALGKAQQAQSLDQFNLQQRSNANSTNVENKNAAQQANIRRAQQVSDSNVGTLNKQQDHNKDLEYTKFQDRLRKLGITTEANNTSAAMRRDRAASVIQENAGAGKAIGSGLDAYFGMPSEKPSMDNSSTWKKRTDPSSQE